MRVLAHIQITGEFLELPSYLLKLTEIWHNNSFSLHSQDERRLRCQTVFCLIHNTEELSPQWGKPPICPTKISLMVPTQARCTLWTGIRRPKRPELRLYLVTTRILIVDDHPVVRMGVRLVLTGDPKWEVCGEAANGEEALRERLRNGSRTLYFSTSLCQS